MTWIVGASSSVNTGPNSASFVQQKPLRQPASSSGPASARLREAYEQSELLGAKAAARRTRSTPAAPASKRAGSARDRSRRAGRAN